MSPARYAWRGSLFCYCFSMTRESGVLAPRMCLGRSSGPRWPLGAGSLVLAGRGGAAVSGFDAQRSLWSVGPVVTVGCWSPLDGGHGRMVVMVEWWSWSNGGHGRMVVTVEGSSRFEGRQRALLVSGAVRALWSVWMGEAGRWR
jgi:hypothetical protein